MEPNGCVILESGAVGEPFHLISWGSFSDGWDRFWPQMFYAASTRLGRTAADEVVEELVSFDLNGREHRESQDPRTYSLINASCPKDALQLRLKLATTYDSFRGESSFLCDVKRGVLLASEGKSFPNGVLHNESKTHWRYDFERFGCIPLHRRGVTTRVDGGIEIEEIATEQVDWTPVPLGVFSFEAQGITSLQPEGVWWRRLTVVFWGLLLFGVVFLVHWYRNREVE
jgi:hypothetical protein